jgi:copper oxidase (laccase) domain-containing protein
MPAMLAGPGAVAAVHCGWRGLAGEILLGTVARLCEVCRCEPEVIRAAIGPGIGPCCYRVGSDVLDALDDAKSVLRGDMLDLGSVASRQLERAGVRADHTQVAGICVSCNPGLFFSHRRDGGLTGRQGGLVWLSY